MERFRDQGTLWVASCGVTSLFSSFPHEISNSLLVLQSFQETFRNIYMRIYYLSSLFACLTKVLLLKSSKTAGFIHGNVLQILLSSLSGMTIDIAGLPFHRVNVKPLK